MSEVTGFTVSMSTRQRSVSDNIVTTFTMSAYGYGLLTGGQELMYSLFTCVVVAFRACVYPL